MAFDANRDIKVEAAQSVDGTFVLRTKGMVAKKRPELELAGVPEAALYAAGKIVNDVADYSVNRAEISADQNVGFALTIDGEEGAALALVVRTRQVEAPKSGLFWKTKGVLRLHDVAGSAAAPPLTALATMLVHRAAARRAAGDDAGAKEELGAALRTLPGESDAGDAPTVEMDAVYNWQNHRAYLALAELEGEDGGPHYADALDRSRDLQRRELGATFAELQGHEAAALEREAKSIVTQVLATLKIEGAIAGSQMVPSPIWETTSSGAARRMSIVPTGVAAFYYEGRARAVLESTGPRLAAQALARAASNGSLAALAWRLRPTRNIWISSSAPFVEERKGAAPVLLSTILADVGRTAHAGATDEEIASRLEGKSLASVEEKLGRLAIWETERIMAALGGDGSN